MVIHSLWVVISADSETRLLCGRVWNLIQRFDRNGVGGGPGTVLSSGFDEVLIFANVTATLAVWLFFFLVKAFVCIIQKFRRCCLGRVVHGLAFFLRGSYNHASMSGDGDHKR